jgi:hypothetical protein
LRSGAGRDDPDHRLDVDASELPGLIAGSLRDAIGDVVARTTREVLNEASGRLD